MKIVVYSHLPKGGGQYVWKSILKELKKYHEIMDFSVYEINKFKNFIDYLIYVYFRLPEINKNIAKKIEFENPDVIIISHDYLTKSPYLLRYLNNCIYLCHEEPREFYQDNIYLINNIKNKLVNYLRLPLKIIDQINVSKARIIISNSLFSQNKLSKIYNREIEVLPMPLNANFNKNWESLNKINQFLTVGSTSYFKGIDFLIKAISLLPQKYKFPLIILGDKGRDDKNIEKLSKKLKVKIVRISNLSDPDLIKKYSESMLLLSAAHNEPFGMSLIEALACGLRVVAVNEGGYKEIIDNNVINLRYGKLVNRKEVEFANAIIEMLTVKDPNSKKIHLYIQKKYNIDNTINKLSMILNTL